jgi:hypothetical protein
MLAKLTERHFAVLGVPLAQDRARAGCLGDGQSQRLLPPSAVRPVQGPPRPEEGHRRRGRLDALGAIYRIIASDASYRDLGAAYFDRHAKAHVAKRRLTALGSRVELGSAA